MPKRKELKNEDKNESQSDVPTTNDAQDKKKEPTVVGVESTSSPGQDKRKVIGDIGEENTEIPDREVGVEGTRLTPLGADLMRPKDDVTSSELDFTGVIRMPQGHLVKPPFRSSYESGIVMNVTPTHKQPYFDLRHKLRIGSFNDYKSYIWSFYELVLKLFSFHRGIPVALDTVPEEIFKLNKILDPSKMGFNVISNIKSLDEPDRYRDVILSLKTLESVKVDSSADLRQYTIGTTDIEHRLYVLCQQIDQLDIGEVREMHSFLKSFDTPEYLINPMPIIAENREKMQFPRELTAYNSLVINNRLLWTTFIKFHEDIAKQKIVIQTADSDKLVTNLLRTMESKTSQAKFENLIPSKINPMDIPVFVRQLWMSLAFGEICRLHKNIDLTTFEPFVLMDCLLLKLMVPLNAITYETMMDIDNYLCRWLVPAIVRVNDVDRIIKDYDEMDAQQTNFLTLNINAGLLNHMPRMRDFLLTTENGGGWLSANGFGSAPVPPKSARFLNPQPYLFPYLCGKRLDNSDSSNSVRQWVLFSEAVEELRSVNRPNFRFIRAKSFHHTLKDILGFIASMGTKMGLYCYYFDKLQANMSVLSTKLQSPLAKPKRRHTYKFILETFVGFTVYNLLDFTLLDRTPLDMSLVRQGWAVHTFVNELIEHYVFASSMLPSLYWNSRQRLRISLDNIEYDPGIKQAFVDKLGESSIVDELKLPTTAIRQNFVSCLKEITEVVRSSPEYFGFLRQWYFSASRRDLSSPLIDYSWLAPDTVDIVMTRSKFEESLQENKLGDIVENVRDKQLTYLMEIPIMCDHMVIDSIPTEMPAWNFNDTTKVFSLNTLKWYFSLKDEVWKQSGNKNALARKPEILTDKPIALDHTRFEQHIPTYFHNVTGYSRGFILHDLELFTFAASSSAR
jgi:hypothetical protein